MLDVVELFLRVAGPNPVVQGLVGGLIITGFNMVGALAILGAWAVVLAAPLLPYAMGFAAGGMLFVISDEIIPETHARGHERLATLGTMIGVLVLLVLDVALG